jgi:hypothetical protein
MVRGGMSDSRLLEQIKSAPEPLKEYLQHLVARVDSAGDVRRLVELEESVRRLTVLSSSYRALIRRLVEDEGCPWGEDRSGVVACAYCGGKEIPSDVPFADPSFDHTVECVWPDIEQLAAE